MARTRIPQTYPYRIPRFKRQENEDLTRCDSAAVLKFLRIELLLRSKEVMALYRAKPQHVKKMYLTNTNRAGVSISRKPPTLRTRLLGSELEEKYEVEGGWYVLKGAHHHLLHTNPSPSCDAVVDIQAVVRAKGKHIPAEDYLLLDDPRYLCLRFKITVPFDHLKNALRAYYDARRTDKAKELKTSIEQEKQKKGPVVHAAAWLYYLNWYDRYTKDGKTAGEIAVRDFPHDDSKKKTKLVEKGIRQVRRLIPLAVKNRWPPPAQYLH